MIDLALRVGEDVVAHLVRALLLDDGLQLGAAAHLVRGRVRVRVRARVGVRVTVRVRARARARARVRVRARARARARVRASRAPGRA